MRKLTRMELGNPGSEKISVYFLAGVATSPNFMEDIHTALTESISEQTGMEIRSGLLFPYGDWSRSLRPQLREIRHDMKLPPSDAASSIGGKKTADLLCDSIEETVLLVGHSGGGIAALHAAVILSETRPGKQIYTVQIGSPKYAIPTDWRENVLYIYASRPGGRLKDPVCRIGSWGGWVRGSLGLPVWHRMRHAPARMIGIPIYGGHADYFRDGKRDAEGRTNLERMVNAISNWLNEPCKF